MHVSTQPAAIVSLLPNPLPLQQGASGSLTVTINVAQEADTVIALADDAPTVAQVAASVTVPAGTISAAIPVSAVAPGTANVTASVNGTSSTTSVTVTLPPPVVTSIAPATITTPKGTPVTLRVTISHAPNAPAGLAAGTTTIGASYTFTAAATGNSVTLSQSTVLTLKQPVALVLTYRYRSCRDPRTELRARIREIAHERVRYGYRRVHVLPAPQDVVRCGNAARSRRRVPPVRLPQGDGLLRPKNGVR